MEATGIIRKTAIKQSVIVALTDNSKRVIRLIRINNFVVYLSYGLVLIFLLNEAIK